MANREIKLVSILSFLIFTFVLFLAFGKFTIEKQYDGVNTNIASTEQFIKKSINFIIEEKKDFFIKRSKIFFSDEVLDALEKKDRQKFYEEIKDHFKRLQMVNDKFWGLHVILPNNMSFIKVHKPHVSDKMIPKGKKPLIDYVNENKKLITSFDAGKFGYFLRVVIPIFSKESKYLGVAEFSVNVDKLTGYIKDTLGYESQFLVKNIQKKKFLNNLPRTKDGLVIFKTTQSRLFSEGAKSNGDSHFLIEDKGLYSKTLHYNDRVYKAIKIKLSDTAVLEVAFEITDIYNEHIEFEDTILFLVALVTLLSVIVWTYATKLFIQVKTDEKEKRKKDQQMFEQAKMAAMGDMIGNISHQWRQPLSAISTAASGIKMGKEFGTLSDEEFLKMNNGIVEQTKYLSQTIDTFRSFIKEKKEVKNVILQDRITMALNIVSASLKDHFIELVDNIDYGTKIPIRTVVGELDQVIINIVNNAKDQLKPKANAGDDAWVKIELERQDKKLILSIEDNGGGIPDDVLPKIFDPYFTTKDDAHGTGLGLSMSKRIITESLNGTLYVKNTENGAKFFIELPLNS